MIGEQVTGPPERAHARTHDAEPGTRDLVLEVAVIPGKAAALAGAALRIAGRRAERRGLAEGLEEVVRIAEQDEIRRAVRIMGDHVEETQLRMIRQRLRDLVVGIDDRVEAHERAGLPLERAGHRGGLRRIAVDMDARRVVEMHAERRGIAELGRKYHTEIEVDLALCGGGVAARRGDAVASCRGRLRDRTAEMIIFVGPY